MEYNLLYLIFPFVTQGDMAKCGLSGISAPVYVLVILFNLASWIDISAVFSELPLLVNRLPEGWELSSYVSTLINSCKPAVFLLIFLKHIYKERIPDVPLIYFIIVSGAGALFCLAFTWDKTVTINGSECSLPLFINNAFLGLVDSLSLVVFLPYLADFDSQYMSAYFVGAGLNKIIPSGLSMLQGIDERPDCINRTTIYFNETTRSNVTQTVMVEVYPDPRFSVRVFFLVVAAIMTLSGVSFTLLHYLPYCKRARMGNKQSNNCGRIPEVVSFTNGEGDEPKMAPLNKWNTGSPDVAAFNAGVNDATKVASFTNGDKHLPEVFPPNNIEENSPDVAPFNNGVNDGSEVVLVKNYKKDTDEVASRGNGKKYGEEEGSFKIGEEVAAGAGGTHSERNRSSLFRLKDCIIISLLVGWLNAMRHGLALSILPFAAMPYGNRAYSLTVRVGKGTCPLGALFAVFYSPSSYAVTSLLSLISTLCAVYLMILAAYSPTPPLMKNPLGEILVVRIASVYSMLTTTKNLRCSDFNTEDSGNIKNMLFFM